MYVIIDIVIVTDILYNVTQKKTFFLFFWDSIFLFNTGS